MLDRNKLYDKLYAKFGRRSKMTSFADRIIDHCENWSNNKDISTMDPKEIHDTLKEIIMQEESKHSKNGGFAFIPAFIWMFLLGQLVSFIIKWWLENRT